MKLTREQLNEIKARPEKATAGPLCGASEQGKDAVLWSIFASDIPFGGADRIASFRHYADAVLFQHAGTDIPALLAYIEELSAALDEAKRDTARLDKIERMATLAIWHGTFSDSPYNISLGRSGAPIVTLSSMDADGSEVDEELSTGHNLRSAIDAMEETK